MVQESTESTSLLHLWICLRGFSPRPPHTLKFSTEGVFLPSLFDEKGSSGVGPVTMIVDRSGTPRPFGVNIDTPEDGI